MLKITQRKLIKAFFRSNMSGERLSNLSIISIENALASALDYTYLKIDFVTAKLKKDIS